MRRRGAGASHIDYFQVAEARLHNVFEAAAIAVEDRRNLGARVVFLPFHNNVVDLGGNSIPARRWVRSRTSRSRARNQWSYRLERSECRSTCSARTAPRHRLPMRCPALLSRPELRVFATRQPTGGGTHLILARSGKDLVKAVSKRLDRSFRSSALDFTKRTQLMRLLNDLLRSPCET